MSRQRVLIVDDEPNVVRALARILRHEEATLVGVDSAAKALVRLATESFDLVISDLRMPDMAGVDFLALLDEFHPGTRRVMISGTAGVDDLRQVATCCAVEQFVRKPWNPDDIRALLRR